MHAGSGCLCLVRVGGGGGLTSNLAGELHRLGPFASLSGTRTMARVEQFIVRAARIELFEPPCAGAGLGRRGKEKELSSTTSPLALCEMQGRSALQKGE